MTSSENSQPAASPVPAPGETAPDATPTRGPAHPVPAVTDAPTEAPVAGEGVAPEDLAAVARQLGREPRGVVGVAHRCPCGDPDVLATASRLPDGTPFPTTFYATCPRLTGAISTLESAGLMKDMSERLAADPDLAERYCAAHEDYLRRRARLGDVPEIDGISAGGMPERVKCLHVLAGHALAAGPGVNPLGDETLAALPDWWAHGSCTRAPEEEARP
ncbi:DUF501 domain-containing protein [Mobilicoccus pelagius]|uniref:Septum formation initiator family protein n=1 Tax=Mobilicoccus pelagius NBRC 104925 TaxID=1089455 RepID=H5USC5_9MICO|nr:DUF501 domain-containing protein [Mobilicoccus pelagius]GAB48633.1 hypothetical protein MOPEL_078_00220 [Mobilicoccus pelagius NBRC 104925]